MQPQPGMGAHAQQPDADADASHALPWLQLPADAAQLLPELQQLYHTYQVSACHVQHAFCRRPCCTSMTAGSLERVWHRLCNQLPVDAALMHPGCSCHTQS